MNYGPFLIMIAASLWALDGLLRTNLSGVIPSAWIVMIEHAVGSVLLSPLFWRGRKKFGTLTGKDWMTLIALTIVSSVAGTVLFTEALSQEMLRVLQSSLLQESMKQKGLLRAKKFSWDDLANATWDVYEQLAS